MSENIRGTYLCLLDDVDLEDNLTLDEFDIRYYAVEEIISFLKGSEQGISSEERHRLESYSKFPWARMERIISPDKLKNNFSRMLLIHDLAWKHAGMLSWEPFTELIRTLNLLKESPGPVIIRQFYFSLYPNATMKPEVGKVIYGEPSFETIDNGSGSRIRPYLLEYFLGSKDVAGFSNLREQLSKCLSKDSDLPNSHLRIAIHYFENGDRRLKAPTLTGSFNAIDPLMSYDAALEALVIREDEGGISNKLPHRISSVINTERSEVRNFCKRLFRLRSKVAHGAWPIEKIERKIITEPDAEIEAEDNRPCIPEGNYKQLFLTSHVFPGFLVNLREITRRTIRFFCDEHLKGRNREDILDELDQ
jgi:hypothetical protein